MNERNKLAKQYKQLKKKYVQLQKEWIRCQHDYIHWKSLDEEFALFQQFTHMDDSDTDFPPLVM